jgi:galactofuranosylgalactofuranosylrhamnosyl-N-acetylglucosaminyl-diphospho-decaprenol beta-1,5/1,6-galactofuranosyltransferase
MTDAPTTPETTLLRLRFPLAAELFGLYFRSDHPVAVPSGPGPRLALQPGQAVSTSTWFNSLFERPYLRHTGVRTARWSLALQGDLRVTMERRHWGGRREVLAQADYTGCRPDEPVSLPLALPGAEAEAGRVTLTLAAPADAAQPAELHGGRLLTDHPARDASMAVVICTYRREDFLRPTLERILADDELMAKGLRIIIIDNGRTLGPDFLDHPAV